MADKAAAVDDEARRPRNIDGSPGEFLEDSEGLARFKMSIDEQAEGTGSRVEELACALGVLAGNDQGSSLELAESIPGGGQLCDPFPGGGVPGTADELQQDSSLQEGRVQRDLDIMGGLEGKVRGGIPLY